MEKLYKSACDRDIEKNFNGLLICMTFEAHPSNVCVSSRSASRLSIAGSFPQMEKNRKSSISRLAGEILKKFQRFLDLHDCMTSQAHSSNSCIFYSVGPPSRSGSIPQVENVERLYISACK